MDLMDYSSSRTNYSYTTILKLCSMLSTTTKTQKVKQRPFNSYFKSINPFPKISETGSLIVQSYITRIIEKVILKKFQKINATYRNHSLNKKVSKISLPLLKYATHPETSTLRTPKK